MNNNDIFKKLRVALQLRDDQIVEILNLVDFRISKGEIGNFFRTEDHPKFVSCGDQILRNFLNGLILYLRGTKENPKTPMQELEKIKNSKITLATPKSSAVEKKPLKKQPISKKAPKKPVIVEKVKYKNGKKKES
ncbi:DUF1456 family protein [Flavobacterium croceum]|uniref:DUF1456 family protein n=1 Tax=Flavobacterium croceum TaxID=370975 RepID=UPI0024A8C436|nr:DUF1456 family protein [Flavobacterium croceum]